MNKTKKEEILEKSREWQQDEGYVNALNKGFKIGGFCVMVAAGLIIIINLIKGLPVYGALSVIFAFEAGASYPRYRFTKYKSYLISSIICTIVSIVSLVMYIAKIW